jgi:ribosomal protein L11 methyltransferase
MPRGWLEIRLHTTADQVELVTGVLLSLGVLSAAIDGVDGTTSLRFYFPDDEAGRRKWRRAAARLRQVLAGNVEWSEHWLEPRDWSRVWQEDWQPTRVGRVVVAPTWEQAAVGPDEILIRLDPEMAFGTGAHESTRLCLLALQQCVRGGDCVWDIGAGSGILSIAAALLGAGRAVAVEREHIAADTARRNVERNRCASRVGVVVGDGVSALRGACDVAVANIDATVARDLTGEIAAHLPAGGWYVAGGFTDAAESVLRDGMQPLFDVAEALRENRWCCLVGRRRPE